MTPERWQHLKELFQAALEREVSGRAAFLDEACAGVAMQPKPMNESAGGAGPAWAGERQKRPK